MWKGKVAVLVHKFEFVLEDLSIRLERRSEDGLKKALSTNLGNVINSYSPARGR